MVMVCYADDVAAALTLIVFLLKHLLLQIGSKSKPR